MMRVRYKYNVASTRLSSPNQRNLFSNSLLAKSNNKNWNRPVAKPPVLTQATAVGQEAAEGAALRSEAVKKEEANAGSEVRRSLACQLIIISTALRALLNHELSDSRDNLEAVTELSDSETKINSLGFKVLHAMKQSTYYKSVLAQYWGVANCEQSLGPVIKELQARLSVEINLVTAAGGTVDLHSAVALLITATAKLGDFEDSQLRERSLDTFKQALRDGYMNLQSAFTQTENFSESGLSIDAYVADLDLFIRLLEGKHPDIPKLTSMFDVAQLQPMIDILKAQHNSSDVLVKKQRFLDAWLEMDRSNLLNNEEFKVFEEATKQVEHMVADVDMAQAISQALRQCECDHFLEIVKGPDAPTWTDSKPFGVELSTYVAHVQRLINSAALSKVAKAAYRNVLANIELATHVIRGAHAIALPGPPEGLKSLSKTWDELSRGHAKITKAHQDLDTVRQHVYAAPLDEIYNAILAAELLAANALTTYGQLVIMGWEWLPIHVPNDPNCVVFVGFLWCEALGESEHVLFMNSERCFHHVSHGSDHLALVHRHVFPFCLYGESKLCVNNRSLATVNRVSHSSSRSCGR